MKNRIIVLSSVLLISAAANAQLFLGAKVGLNVANISTTFANTTFNNKIGINGGAAVKYHFGNGLSAQMDILYSQLGAKSSMVVLTDDGTNKVTTTTETIYDFSYIQVPVFANYEIPIKSESIVPYRLLESVVSIHLTGGGYFGYALSNNESTSQKTETKDPLGNITTDVLPKTSGSSKNFNSVDFGIAFGAGVSFKLSKVGRLTVDGRLLMGMANFNNNGFTDGATYPAMKNLVAPQVQLGYIHRITKPKRWKS